MQVFRTRFTADVTQIRTAMAEMRNNVRGAMDSFRRVASVGSIAFAGSGLSVGMLGKSMISLAADMEKTKVAFEVMLGGAERAKVVLGDLVKFADVTPFDTAEIIQAGRSLIACGTATDQLTDRLTLLGNIAAGTGMSIGEMTSLYAKMKNTGKVQTEELNQMADRGIPIYRLLTEMLRINQTELASMAEKGQLSFALIEEALEKLGGKGGQYFGLIEKQSKTLDGLWSTLRGNIRQLATSLGELVIPELSKNIKNVIDELDRMKKSGELDRVMHKTADAIKDVLRSITDIALFLSENRDRILDTAGVIACWYAWGRLNGVLVSTGHILQSMRGMNFVSGFRSLRRISPVVKALTADISALRRALGSVAAGLQIVGSAAAVAFTGWKIGKQIGELLKLEKVFTRLALLGRGMSEDEVDYFMNGGGQKVTASVTYVDEIETENKLKKNSAEINKLKKSLAFNEKANAPDKEQITGAIREKIKSLENESKALREGIEKYEKDVKKAVEREAEIRKRLKTVIDDESQLEKRKKELEQKVEPEYLGVPEPNMPGQPGLYVPKNPVQDELRQELTATKTRLDQLKKQRIELGDQLNAELKTIAEYNEGKKRRERKSTEDLVAEGERRSAAEEVIAKRRLEYQKEVHEKEVKLAEERKKLRKGQQTIFDESNRDFVTQRIQGWRDEIEKWESEIDKAEKKLQRFGATLEDDLLKSPEQIAQDRKDEILRKKIDAYNQGAKVTFTKEEQSRIQELQHEQKRARLAMEGKTSNESSIRSAERSLDAYDRRREIEDRRERANELKNRAATMKAAEDQLRIAKEANQPMESVLKKIEEILKYGLPNQTV